MQTRRDVKRTPLVVAILAVLAGLAIPWSTRPASAVLPEHLEQLAPHPQAPPRTTILVLRWNRSSVELVSFADKPLPAERPAPGSALWTLEDPSSGAPLEQGSFALPALCDCAIGHDHAQGCVVVHHEAVFRLKVPRIAPRERLRLVAPDGRELGSFLLEPSS